MTEHRREFHRELEVIEANVVELFGMVAEDLPKATEALLNGDRTVVRTLADRDKAIDSLYPQIEELADRELVLQGPLGSDLRYLVSVLRVVPELERSHDLVVDIARRGGYILGDDLSPRARGLVEQRGIVAADMWREAVDCWSRRDRAGAATIDDRDDEMDELFAGLMAELGSGRMTLPVTMEMTLVARFYERLGDHAVNIARRVVYLAGHMVAAPA